MGFDQGCLDFSVLLKHRGLHYVNADDFLGRDWQLFFAEELVF